ncbi:hybrid sensor histidine kinase/response regulator [Dyadobacter luteus]|uniref:histidine kinase n=1 Tax=Dyadobacter luteus TaxID=2259619 RepID=A0A3D8Y8V1_9BACT|nr:ATP-binding protein [Dyadobacter luteus]REA59067.1 hybrid sensor histidine kinase/response regulator [Dyadobacter luteus]
MSPIRHTSFTGSVKGKVLLGFLVAAIALGTSWVITKLAFENMLTKLEVLSTPNDQLRLVNKVFKNILQLDHLQNERSLSPDEKKEQFIVKSRELMSTLDTLSLLSIDDPMQIIRIDSMKRILAEREQIFGNYVKVKSKLVSNQDLADEVKSISGLITTNKRKPDSTVVKTEKRTTTTTTYTEVPDPFKKQGEEDKKGFFGRVFSSKKNKKEPANVPAKIVQKQEVNVEVDTLKVAPKDSVIEMVSEAVHAIEKSQKKRTSSFIDREQELSTAGNSLVTQLINVMQEVENEVVRQADREGNQSQKMAAASIDRLEWVMLGFFCLTALLAYLIFTDITKSNKYRNELEEAKEEAEYHSMAKQRFLSNMSHEIRTPLQSIIGYTEALKKDQKPKEQDLNNLHTASEHLLYLVNEVLDYSRIISDQFTFEQRTFAITPLLNEVIQMLLPMAQEKDLALTLENTIPDETFLKGDPFRLRQILYNLLTNAIKFTHKGKVSLKASSKETSDGIAVSLKISDTGIGMSEEQAARVFNQFEQADPSISRRYGGTGLGLSIVKSLVEGMDGTIVAESKPGKGTVFSSAIVFPKAESMITTEDQIAKKVYNIQGKVWLVDDDAFILKWCSSVLEMHNVQHVCFSSGEQVLAQPWDDEVKFVLTDMRMPGMNGAEMCAQLRLKVPGDVKFYVLTAQALPEERSKILNMGFDGILMKPFHSNQLLELLEKSSAKAPSSTRVKRSISPGTEFDLTILSEMTFGDESLMREILDQFVSDSKKDIASLQHMVDMKQTSELHELMHRMAGRTGQIGASEVSGIFRQYEIALREDEKAIAARDISNLIARAANLVEQVEQKASSYSM